MSDRRREKRTRASGLSARLRPGHRVLIVDVSSGGALFEAMRPLCPGADVEVQFEGSQGRVRVSGTVLRCGVTAIDPHQGPTYRAAVAFNDTFEWAREEGTHRGYGVHETGRRSLRFWSRTQE